MGCQHKDQSLSKALVLMSASESFHRCELVNIDRAQAGRYT